jgi:phosphoadenylyl-sulfate reductase (thioredoxin)
LSTNPASPEEDGEGTVEDAARRLEACPPEEILTDAAARFGPRIAFATGFGPEGCVLLDVIARHRLPIEVLTLDTGLLFPETRTLWRRLEERYGLRIRGLRPRLSVEEQAAEHGPRLWERNPDRCCGMRKLEPLAGVLPGLDAWVTAIRREQTEERRNARVVERDRRFGLVKVNPLAAWTHAQVWDHVRENDVPVNALHARGYASIGCWPCTTAVRAGEDPRAGRWRHCEKTECGLHLRRSLPGSERVLSFGGGAGE